MRMSAVPKKTSSRCITVAETGSHTFEIVGYSLQKGTGVGKFVRSGTFTVGGYDWSIRFYPDGSSTDSEEYVTICLELMTSNATARASYHLRLASQQSPLCWWGCKSGPRLFKSCDVTRFGPRNWDFILRCDLEEEESCYLVDDSIRIECEVTVIREPQLSETRVESEIEVPPCDMMAHFGKLLEQKKGTDVSFIVGGDSFEAHKIVLVARSPVFMAEFYGRMRESGMCCVTVQDMQPDVFRALLHFIYTDSLPDMDDLDRDEYSEMIQHLLVASDRYAMERLKLMCQCILRKNLDVETVATTLALADQQNCDELKAACIEFISSSRDVSALVATQGYSSLKRSCPSVLVDLYEKTSKLFKT
ncbi:BTB/POZ and MATH domain-containing protein 2 [Sorghum bicolor]|jgi:speckle-type POZ protein|uniref:BTB domain-containing protein n=1 Tax=Sorghum bicolor TaxID=4558 RepID=A0A1B6PGC3_SORBI|nr:BTB/POZ and MATH domain-containing protein 2 [Sorghum bicolor]XP_021320249.1 BTB/POZ and MATH domain-containing protein 2 [Sorghum bicolor]KXG24742.1 hypothetical protein SORBI_3007G080500 [Sorghum bicolor]|eukprot:XP_021320248.1 BTB/POZ and MATH domain-containing protein 2 [Sorghum bicolor]